MDVTERLDALCAAAGLQLDSVKPSVVARMRLLAEHTKTITDCEHMMSRARNVFRYYDTTKPSEAFSEIERRIVLLGCLFSDIGKTGPRNADARGQMLIVEMFAVEGVRDETQPVMQFLRTQFPADADDRLGRFVALGLDPQMSIREFWNLHSPWTLEIVEGGGLPAEVVAAAATHHLLDNVNPGSIVGADDSFTRSFGDNKTFDRAEKLITLLDKYDAFRRRGRHSHDQAIAWLKDRVENNRRFRGDTEFLTLIADMDAAVRA
jgi:hypothetical protein